MANVLIIDDDPLIGELLIKYIHDMGHQATVAETLSRGVETALSISFDLVFLDVVLPDGNGLESLSSIRTAASEPEVIIITAEANTRGAEMALENNAWDYIVKPFSKNEIRLSVERSLEFRSSRKALSSPENILDRSDIVGQSPSLASCLATAGQCAKSDVNVLISGSTGTGKELFANVIHENSLRSRNRFVVVDCASLPEQLVEAVLFGHVKGAFTGADAAREGLVKNADGGTLFLDEVGELPLSVQKKFLRVLQERRFKPVGSTKEIHSDFRLVSATNRDLPGMVKQDLFRKDLYFRLSTIHIDLPGLKECKSDIKDLTLHYIYRLCEHHDIENKGFVPEFLETLKMYDWPGNTRELINSLEKAVLAGYDSPTLYPNHLPARVRMPYLKSSMEKKQNRAENPDFTKKPANPSFSVNLPENYLNPIKPLNQVKNHIMNETEKLYLLKLLQSTDGNLDKAASFADLSKSHLYALLKKHEISRSG
ncbi:MAG: sigma-54 dependent transcriptional regulator [Desulfobacteraceae bacterium]